MTLEQQVIQYVEENEGEQGLTTEQVRAGLKSFRETISSALRRAKRNGQLTSKVEKVPSPNFHNGRGRRKQARWRRVT